MPRPLQTHCKRGHCYDDPGNTVWYSRADGTRFRLCKPCEAIRRALQRKKNKKAPYYPEPPDDSKRSVRRGPYAKLVAKFREGDTVYDVETTYAHRNEGTVVSVDATYGTVQVDLKSGGVTSMFAGVLRVTERAERAAS